MKSFKLIVLFILFGSTTIAQVDQNSELYITLKANDSLLFDRAFNYCESFRLENLLSENFEFYHDQGGFENSKEGFLQTMKNGICNPNNTTKSRRELTKNSLEVYPLYQNGNLYAAIQKGVHRFYETPLGKQEQPGSEAKFTHLWILEEDQWRLRRVLSYDHQSIKK